MGGCTITIAAATRPYPGESANGDAWTVQWHNGACRIAVIDGLGHGPDAAAAAQAAVAALAAQPQLLPEAALRICHDALRGTRGAAISVGTVDAAGSQLTYAGVGNVEAHLWGASQRQRLIAYRGIVGTILPTLRTFTLDLPPAWLLIVHTDGISARFTLPAPGEGLPEDHQQFANELLLHRGRQTDDATVVVAGAHGF